MLCHRIRDDNDLRVTSLFGINVDSLNLSLIISLLFNQVEHEFIYYVHDSSETLDDNFTVVVNDTGLRKQSAAQTVYIQVTAVNDEPPVITANRVLRVSLHRCSIFKLWTFFFTSRSGTIAYCQTIFMCAVLQVAMAGWMRETMFAMWRRVQGGLQHRTDTDIHLEVGLVGRSVIVLWCCVLKQILV